MYGCVFILLFTGLTTLTVDANITISSEIPVQCGQPFTLSSVFLPRAWYINLPNGTSFNASLYPDKYKISQDMYNLTVEDASVEDSRTTFEYVSSFSVYTRMDIPFECRVVSTSLEVLTSKKVNISADKVYPANATYNHLGGNEFIDNQRCEDSERHPGYYKCYWYSERSLANRNYSSRFVIQTVSYSSIMSAEFEIVRPFRPEIGNTANLSSKGNVIQGGENQMITIYCSSRGGYPAQTLTLLKNADVLFQKNATLQSNERYDVSYAYQFHAKRSDDLSNLTCRSSYPDADNDHRDVQETTAILYLTLSCQNLTFDANKTVSSGNMFRASGSVSGCRPVPSVSWQLGGLPVSGSNHSHLDNKTETYTISFSYGKTVSPAENGQEVELTINQPSSGYPHINRTIVLDVLFPPDTTTIAGNTSVIADGVTPLELTCTAGTSNPVSTMQWLLNDSPTERVTQLPNQQGQYGGIVAQSRLTLYPTRNHVGFIIKCIASYYQNGNNVTVQSEKVLDELKYSPVILSTERTKVGEEGDPNFKLYCSVSSYPTSTITWFKASTQLHSGFPTKVNNSTYTIALLDRTDAAEYKCVANNGIGSPAEHTITVIVKYSPAILSTEKTKEGEEGDLNFRIYCSVSGYPTSTITWFKNSNQLHSGYLTLGNNSTYTISQLDRTDAAEYKCVANNGIGSPAEHTLTVIVKYSPHFENTASTETGVEGSVNFKINCFVSSYPTSTFTWYKNSNRQYSGIQTNGNNSTYTISRLDRTDAAEYKCVASNWIGSPVEHRINVIVYHPPDAPKLLGVFTVTEFTAEVSWLKNNNGGRKQYFVVQRSTDGKIWINSTGTPDDNTQPKDDPFTTQLEGLQHSTTYTVRMFAYNQHGASDFSSSTNFTTAVDVNANKQQSGDNAGVVGGVVGSLLALAVIVIVVIVLKLRFNVSLPMPSFLQKDRQDRNDDSKTEDENNYTDLHTYKNVSFQPEENTEYSGLDVRTVVPDEAPAPAKPADIGPHPQKQHQNLIHELKELTTEKQVYENVSRVNKKVPLRPKGKKKTKEKMYENVKR